MCCTLRVAGRNSKAHCSIVSTAPHMANLAAASATPSPAYPHLALEIQPASTSLQRTHAIHPATPSPHGGKVSPSLCRAAQCTMASATRLHQTSLCAGSPPWLISAAAAPSDMSYAPPFCPASPASFTPFDGAEQPLRKRCVGEPQSPGSSTLWCPLALPLRLWLDSTLTSGRPTTCSGPPAGEVTPRACAPKSARRRPSCQTSGRPCAGT